MPLDCQSYQSTAEKRCYNDELSDKHHRTTTHFVYQETTDEHYQHLEEAKNQKSCVCLSQIIFYLNE